MERLGLGPDELLQDNPRSIYGRVTGWGQRGRSPGGGARHQLYRDHRLAARDRAEGSADGANQLSRRLCRRRHDAGIRDGLGAACRAARRGGQVIDAAMSDGAALVGALTYGLRAAGIGATSASPTCSTAASRPTASTAAPTASSSPSARSSRNSARRCSRGWHWRPGASREEIETVIASRTRDQWAPHFAGTDACVAPVLDLGEAPVHPHNIARRTFIDLDGVFQPAPAPHYSKRRLDRPEPPRREGEDGERSSPSSAMARRNREILKVADETRSTSRWRPACSSACRSPRPSMARSTWAGVSGLRLARRNPRGSGRALKSKDRTNMRRRVGYRSCARRSPRITRGIRDSI